MIDETFWSQGLNPSSDWRVDDGYTHSDHLAIRNREELGGRRAQPSRMADLNRAAFVAKSSYR